MDNVNSLNLGDIVLVKCKVEGVFGFSQMAMVTTRDCDKGFDAYVDEIYGLYDEEKEYVVKTNLKSYRYKYKKCGNCGKEYRKKDAYNYAYCPICGAKFINVKK